jgi:ubiquinone biosynthesis protein
MATAMSDWMQFCEGLDIGPLVPDEAEKYRSVIVDSLGYFLENLPQVRTIEILAEQAAMPSDTGIDERLVAIARHCPSLHKLGQVLARDRRLSPRFRRLLQSLESMRPTQSLSLVRTALERELGPLSKLGVTLGESPLAEASVAVVIPFILQDGRHGERRRGVFKLLKSGIEEKLGEELDLLRRVGAFLQDRCRMYGLPDIDYESSFEQVAELLALEPHLDREQQHMATARRAYQDMTSVLVPELYPFSTPRVTAMERVDGCKVTDVGNLSSTARRELAVSIVDALVGHAIWSDGPTTMFHADPHAGNLLFTDDRRLAIVDWSLVGYLTKQDQIKLSELWLGAMTLNAGQVAEAIRGLATGGVDETALCRIVNESLGRLNPGRWPGLRWLTGLLQDAITEGHARPQPGLVIFRKTLESLTGVVADVSEDCHLDSVLASFFLKQFEQELPYRMIAPPFSRDFNTHLSNADLVKLWMSAPLTASISWFRLQRETMFAGSTVSVAT